MEITLEAIISLVGLFIGGGGGAFFTWRYMRRKAKAEAVTSEIDAAKDLQDLYKKMLESANEYVEDADKKADSLRSERDHYKTERNELRDRIEKMDESVRTLRKSFADKEIETDRKIAQLGRKVEAMRPFLCGDLKCKKRQLVEILEQGESKDGTD